MFNINKNQKSWCMSFTKLVILIPMARLFLFLKCVLFEDFFNKPNAHNSIAKDNELNKISDLGSMRSLHLGYEFFVNVIVTK